MAKHDIIGDVRGKGLMTGIELVKDRGTKEAATQETVRVWERARTLGLLIGKGLVLSDHFLLVRGKSISHLALGLQGLLLLRQLAVPFGQQRLAALQLPVTGRDQLALVFEEPGALGQDVTKIPQELTTPNYRVSEISGIGAEAGVERQDPSNVIRVGDTFYVWYTRRKSGVHPYASTLYFATSKDGRNWTEKGEALGKGAADAWDSFGVITPYVAVFDVKYYLYYTGTHAPDGFRSRDPNGTLRHIGVAVADQPDGPWRRFADNPVLSPGQRGTWDELLVDDAHLIAAEGMGGNLGPDFPPLTRQQ